MRNRLYQIISDEYGDKAGNAYNIIMIIVIVVSLVPLTVHNPSHTLIVIDHVSICIFIIDYLMRLATADFQLHKGGASFLLYAVTPMAIIDLITILTSLSVIPTALRILKLFRLFRTLSVVRSFKLLRYSRTMDLIIGILKDQRKPLLAVCALAVGYILVAALVIFNVEPDTFPTFFDAAYWATISLTTIGYGDIYPVTTIGRVVTIVSSFVGIAVIALPASILTAGYMERINENKDEASQR